ncbi:flagellar biosynthetic protein FliP [Monaibacterium marinum]|uniref:Flagellar biosynthetic protein FliP n=1 Tax=Pontivivens marinum TaxID=1690039 RepID=A0A2C9CSU0_9RHOB|nr:flagellar type III secretion system pore protein FliP [Monaibacterium marinum]SOH94394.1 flagellar biosynthetic protein FliP [Monaibacterium marinum]
MRFSLFLLTLLVLAFPASAQSVALDLGGDGSVSMRTVQLFLMVTVLSLAPGLAVMLTCFPFIVTVLSILRQAIGVQQAPPNMLIVSLALFLTWFVMEPTLQAAWQSGISPMIEGTLSVQDAIPNTIEPFRGFMQSRVNHDTLVTLADARGIVVEQQQPPLNMLVPAFMLTEVQRGFEVGFLIFLPFLVIDLVIAAILMSMGMMMVPPAVVALPFKLAFFVLADGWALLAGALIRSYEL